MIIRKSCRARGGKNVIYMSAVRELKFAAQLSSTRLTRIFRIGTPSSSGVLNSLAAGQQLISDVADVRIFVLRTIRSHAQ